MGYGSNFYYNPEMSDLTIVADMEWSEPCYDFDQTVAWKDKEGNLYWASDSGCSCPMPFEDYTEVSQLTTGTKYDLFDELNARLNEMHDKSYAEGQVAKFVEQILNS